MSSSDSSQQNDAFGLPAKMTNERPHTPERDNVGDGAEKERSSSQLTGSIVGWAQILAVIAIVAGAFVFNALVSGGGEEPPLEAAREEPSLASLFQPEATSQTLSVTGTGVVRSRAMVTLSPQVSGRVVAVGPAMAPGGAFEPAETLFRIDPADYVLALSRAEAQLATANSDFQLAEAEAQTAEREWSLINPGEPVPDLVARKPQIAQAIAAIATAETAVSEAKTNLSRSRFSLPFRGRIVQSDIEAGQTLSAGQTYGQAYALENVEVRVSVDPGDLQRLGSQIIGNAAIVRSAMDGGQVSAAEVARIEAELHAQTRMVGVILRLLDPGQLLPGTFIEATISGRSVDNVFVLPEQTVGQSGRVWVVDGNVLAERFPVVIQRKADSVIVEYFDSADGVVLVGPPSPYVGKTVSLTNESPSDDTLADMHIRSFTAQDDVNE